MPILCPETKTAGEKQSRANGSHFNCVLLSPTAFHGQRTKNVGDLHFFFCCIIKMPSVRLHGGFSPPSVWLGLSVYGQVPPSGTSVFSMNVLLRNLKF